MKVIRFSTYIMIKDPVIGEACFPLLSEEALAKAIARLEKQKEWYLQCDANDARNKLDKG